MKYLYDKFTYQGVTWRWFFFGKLELGYRDGELKTVYLFNRLMWGDLDP